jgi:hypothetical protein
VDELLALCVVLKISPVDLLVPQELKGDQPYLVTPKRTARAANVREFIQGEEYLYVFPYPEPVRDPESLFASPTGHAIDTLQWMPPDRADRVKERYDDTWKEEREQP